MAWFIQDLRFGFRSIRKERSFFLTSVVALALGIGAATVIFSITDNVLLNPFPYVDGNRIYDVEIHDRTRNAAAVQNWFGLREFLDFQEQNHIFDQSFGIWEQTTLLGDASAPESLDTDVLTGNAFRILGIPAMLGRGIQPSDAEPGAPPVFVLSYKVWVKRFGLDRSIVGKTFLLDNKPTTLIGIMPPRFTFWGGDIWMPAVIDQAHPGNTRFVLYGDLKRGLDPRAAASDAAAVIRRMSARYPDSFPKDFSVAVHPLGEFMMARFRPTLYLLMAAVGMILLIACANVANLLLAQAARREKEFALRRALGASRFRLIAQLLIESLLLAFSGAAAGCALASAGLKGLLMVLPIFTFPDEAAISLNDKVLLATVVTAMLTAMLFGLVPALMASRRETQESLVMSSRGNTAFRQGRLRKSFIVSQVALSLLLLSSAGLLMRSFVLQRQIDPGVRTDHLLLSRLVLPDASYESRSAQRRFVSELLPRLESLPVVLSVGVAVEAPPRGAIPTDFDISGITHTSVWKGIYSPCSSGFFPAAGLHLIAGRLPTALDEAGRRPIAVINQTMATHYFGGANPVGRQLRLTALKTATNAGKNSWFEIVGVVADLKNNGLRQPVLPAAFIPYSVTEFNNFNVYLRTAGDPAALSNTLSKNVLALDRSVIPQQTLTMDSLLEIGDYAGPRFNLVLVSAFASIGLVLVCIGVYSVSAYSVVQQQKEIGIRVALGAKPADVRSLVLGASLRFILLGIGIGLFCALFTARLLRSQIWGMSTYDPVTFCAVTSLLVAVGLLASYIPSRRAAKVDPAICLRCE